MSFRDWLEVAWHSSILLLLLPGVLSYLLAHRWARVAVVSLILGALVYHLAMVQDCHAFLDNRSPGYLCRWGS